MTLSVAIADLRDTDTLDYDADVLCSRIAKLTGRIMAFWSDGGWATDNTAELLEKSKLGWLASLAESLQRWPSTTSGGDLILAWTNLGALVEGQLKLFLCVFYKDYQDDLDGIFRCGQKIIPDKAGLEELLQFYKTSITIAPPDWEPYVRLVQTRRNAIHAFQHRDIGSLDEWIDALRVHLSFVRRVGGDLPYPDDFSLGEI
jgi:hypothetical protein